MVVEQIKEPQVRGKFPLPRLPRLGLFAGEIRYPFLGFPDFVVSRSESIDSAIAPQALPNGRCLPANATFLANRPKISTFCGIPGFPEKRGFSGKSGKTRFFRKIRKIEVFPENPEKRGFSGKSQKTTFLEIFSVAPTSARRCQAGRIAQRSRLLASGPKVPGSNPAVCLFFPFGPFFRENLASRLGICRPAARDFRQVSSLTVVLGSDVKMQNHHITAKMRNYSQSTAVFGQNAKSSYS